MSKPSSIKCRVLAVAEQSKELVLIRYAVEKCGYQLWEANTTTLALQLVHDHPPDLVLLDVSSPSVGQENLSLLIEYLQQQQIPLILITSDPPTQGLKKYLIHPTTDYLRRPIDTIGLVLRIKSALWRKGIQTELDFIRQRLKESDHKLQQRTIFDDATGVFNYFHLLNMVKLEFARGVRHNTPLAFLLVDIPCLEQMKENHGVKAGQYLLREVARRIKASLRVTDIIGRCKEDKLGILLPETDLMGAKLVANKICQLIKEHPFSLPASAETPAAENTSRADKSPLKLDIVVGLSAYPDKRVANYEELIEAARRSLALAKERDNQSAYLCTDCLGSGVVGLKS
jgi:diguanylate cyclase (GGDEF)-like protein